MGIKNLISKAGGKAADKVAKLAVLSPEQLKEVSANREKYLLQMPEMEGDAVEELTSRLIAASSTEIFNLYLSQLEDYYVPVKKDYEFDSAFSSINNIRYFNITKWVTDRKENNIEKLVNVYEVLSNEECNIALIFNRKIDKTNVYLAVVNTKNSNDNVDVENYKERLLDAIKGNFPGSDCTGEGAGVVPCLKNEYPYSVACASNIPAEKSEKFISQTIEKLLDGIIPKNIKKEYTIVLLATPVNDIENRKIHLAELYSGLAPYAAWETNFTFTESDSTNANATFGVNVGASAGVQQGQNQSNTTSRGETDSSSSTETDSETQGTTDSTSNTETNTEGDTTTNSTSDTTGGSDSTSSSETTTHTDGSNTNESETEGTGSIDNILKSTLNSIKGGVTSKNASTTTGTGTSTSDAFSNMTSNTTSNTFSNTLTESIAKNVSKSVADTTSKAISNTVGKSIANTLGKAVSNTVSATSGIYKGVNLGANVGANFARSSNVTATVGKNEGIVQHFTNYNIKHLL